MSDEIRVLHVDDNASFSDVVAELLERERDRIVVETETDPEAVLDRLVGERIDCVVSDYQMAEVDGLDLLERVRAVYPDLPFILFTGEGNEEIASHAISAGVSDYVRKGTGTEQVAVLANRIENAVERYRTEQSLEESEAKLRRKSKMLDVILQHVPLHIYIKDEEARHTWVSDYYMGSSEQLGKTDAEYFDQDWAEETTREELEIIESGEPIIKQVRYDPAREMWVLNSKVPWRDEDGEIVGLVGATWDITERKEAQLELERQTERLEKFIRALSHDLRNPLQLAEGKLELAREACDSPHLDTVVEAHERMERILEQTLTLAREGRTVGETTAVSLPERARRCWKTVETEGATLSVEDDCTVEADPDRLAQLLDNLIVNALAHAGDNPTVTIGCTEDGFYVEDDGPGIPDDQREDVLDVGYTTDEKGTGFGLAIVEEIAQAHGWSVTVTDGTEGGARFEFDTTPNT